MDGVRLKNGLRIVNANPRDALRWLHFLSRLDLQTSFLMYEPMERVEDPELCRAAIERANRTPGAAVFLLVDNADNVKGYLKCDVSPLKRKRHVALLNVAIDKSFLGVGEELISRFFEFCKTEEQIRRIEATVAATNLRMLMLAHKLGCRIEGVKKAAMRLGDDYVDEYVVAKYLW